MGEPAEAALLPGRCAAQQHTLGPLLLGHQRRNTSQSHRTAAWRGAMGFCWRSCLVKLPERCQVLPGPSSPASGTGTWAAEQGWGLWGQGESEPQGDPVAETPYPASPLASATMKQMPRAWQKSPMRSCSSSGDSVSTTTYAGTVSWCCHPSGPWGAGAWAHLEGGEEGLRQLLVMGHHCHVGVQLGQDPLGHLGTVPAYVTLSQEELRGRHTVGHPVGLGCCPPQQGAPQGPVFTGGGPFAAHTCDMGHPVGPTHDDEGHPGPYP